MGRRSIRTGSVTAPDGRRPPHRVTFVVGPPGAGKTERLRGRGQTAPAFAYVAGGDRATGASAFGRRIARELETFEPSIALSYATAAAASTRKARPGAFLGEWLASRLWRGELTIALDELHLYAHDRETIEFVVSAIDASPGHVRWILGVRDTDAWPLATWLARDMAAVPVPLPAPAHPRSDEEVTAAARAWYADASSDERASAVLLALAPSIDRLERTRALGETISALRKIAWPAFAVDIVRPAFGRGLLRAHATDGLRVAHLLRAGIAHWPAATRLEAYEALGASTAIVRTINDDGIQLLDDHLDDVVHRAIAVLNADERLSCPIALMLEAMRETELGRHDVAESWYFHAAATASDPATRARVEFEHGSDLLRRDRMDCFEFLERASAESVAPRFAARAKVALGAACAAKGEWERAHAEIDAALALVEREDIDVGTRARVFRQAAYVALRDARPAAASDFANRAIAIAEAAGLDEIVATALSILVVVAESYDDDDVVVVAALARLERCAVRLDHRFLLRYARLARLEAFGERADWNTVESIEATLLEQELANDAIHTNQTLVRIRALRAAGAGHFERALEELEGSGGSAAESEIAAFHAAESAVYAAASGRTGVVDASIATVERLAGESTGPVRALILRSNLYVALARAIGGRKTEARATIAAMRSALGGFPRLTAIGDAIEALLSYGEDRSERTESALFEALAGLRHHRHGGLASVIASLPAGALTAAAV